MKLLIFIHNFSTTIDVRHEWNFFFSLTPSNERLSKKLRDILKFNVKLDLIIDKYVV